jgi:hypothetical protein
MVVLAEPVVAGIELATLATISAETIIKIAAMTTAKIV